jgi:uncharacterized protein (TIGR02996 family)
MPNLDVMQDAFLIAIRAAPDDDAPRLVYADWLEEQGDAPSAEFIRVQCEIASIEKDVQSDEVCGTPGCDCERLPELREKQWALWSRRVNEGLPDGWTVRIDPIPDHPGLIIPMGRVRRGFVEAVRCTADLWLKDAPAILAAHPVRRVVLTTRPEVEEVEENGGVYLRLHGFPGTVGEERSFRLEVALREAWPGISFVLPD